MANTFVKARKFKIAATAAAGSEQYTGSQNFVLGGASDQFVGMIAIHIVDTGSLSASIVVKSRTAHSARETDTVPFLSVPYVSHNVNGTVGTGAYVSTAITTNSMLLVPATGEEISLDMTYVSGTATVYWAPVQGAA